MSNQYLKLRRSSVPGKVPDTGSLDFGELALNTADGLVFMKKSGSVGEEVISIGSGGVSSAVMEYTFATYNFDSNYFVLNGFRSISPLYNPNYGYANALYGPLTDLLNYLPNLYVDIIDTDTSVIYKKLAFNTVADIQTYISTSSILQGRMIFYANQNNTSNLVIGGSNTLSTFLIKKVSSRKELYKRAYYDQARFPGSFAALANFVSSSLYTSAATKINNINEIITQEQIITLCTPDGSGFINNIEVTRFDKYKKRKLSNFLPPILTTVLPDGTTTTPASFKLKLLATALISYQYVLHGIPSVNSFNIETISFIQAAGLPGTSKLDTDPNKSYFHLYIVQDLTNNSRGIAIEFLSIDAITIPFRNTQGYETTPAYSYFLKQGNRIRTLVTSSRIDIIVNVDFVPINNSQNPLLVNNTLRKNVGETLDIIRLYNDKTCDVFEKGLQIVKSTYSHNLEQPTKNLWYYKLNKM